MPYLGNVPATNFSTMSYQDLTGGTGTSFTLDFPAGSAQDIEVFVNNVRQEPGVAYTVAGTALTMTGSIASTDDFYVVFQGKAQQTVVPGANTITAAMLQSGVGQDITKVTSDPTASTNAALGDVYVNTSSGEMFVCVDATASNNVWINVGDGTGGVNTTYSADFLVIAGGGGGGSHSGGGGGAGGAGGYRASYNSEASGGGGSSESSLTFERGVTYTITVGAGGLGHTTTSGKGSNGSDSSISGSNITTVTSVGGAGGAGYSAAATTGGSGGGGTGNGGAAASSGTANQGYAGGAGGGGGTTGGGGGGGAGAVGSAGDGTNGGNGGAGVASTITGSSVTRAGGGGGGQDSRAGGSAGTGGTGGGGAGGKGANGTDGTVNTGGGGGGTGYNGGHTDGADGGSGVVILRMPTAKYSGTTTGSPTVTTDSTDTILTFTSSGTYVG